MDKKKRIIVPIIILIAAIGYAGWSYVRPIIEGDKEEHIYYGTAEAAQIDVIAEEGGRIKDIQVEEGQQVAEGGLLAVLDIPESRIKAEQSELTVQSAANELARTVEGSREEEINIQKALVRQGEAALNQAEALAAQSEQAVKTAEEAYKLKKEQYEDMKVLYESGAATEQQLENAEYAANTAAYSLESAKAQLESSKAQMAAAEAQLAAAQEKLRLLVNGADERSITAAEYNVGQTQKSLELSKLALDKTQISAVRSGTVGEIYYSEGEYIGAGSPLLTITDLTDQWVKIYVPEKALPGLEVGKEVTISSEFLEGKTIKGRISYISPEAEFTPLNIVTKEDRMKLVFAVKVKILDNLDSIKPGMLLDVNIR